MNYNIISRFPRLFFFFAIFFIFLSSPARPEIVDEVVAVVNDEIITRSDLLRAAKFQFLSPDPSRYREVLERLIDQKLIDQATQGMDIKISEKDVDAMIADFKRTNQITDAQLTEILQQQGITWEEYREQVRIGLRRNHAIAQNIRSEISISDKEITEYYQQHPEEFFEPAQVKLERLFFPLPEEKNLKDNKVITIQQKAEEALRRVRSGENFQKIAQELTTPGEKISWDVGVFKKGELFGTLDQAAFTLPPGEISQIIPVGNKGYCIIRVVERTPEKTKKFEEVREIIGNYLYQQKMAIRLQEWIEKLRQNAYIEIKFY